MQRAGTETINLVSFQQELLAKRVREEHDSFPGRNWMCHFKNGEREYSFWSTEKGYFPCDLQKSRHKNRVSPNKRCTDPLQGCSENKWAQAWKLVLDGHNLARGHEVFLFPRARIWKNFIPRFKPSQQSLMDPEYPWIPVLQQKSSSGPRARTWAQPPGLPLLALSSSWILTWRWVLLHTATFSLSMDFHPYPLCPLSGFISQRRKIFPTTTQGGVILGHLAETWWRLARPQKAWKIILSLLTC